MHEIGDYAPAESRTAKQHLVLYVRNELRLKATNRNPFRKAGQFVPYAPKAGRERQHHARRHAAASAEGPPDALRVCPSCAETTQREFVCLL